MKTFDQLTQPEKDCAVKKAIDSLLSAIVEGAVRFNDKLNQDDLQARIDSALKDAEANHTPWFAGEYIMSVCKEEIEGMAQCDAEDALYHEAKDPRVVFGIAS